MELLENKIEEISKEAEQRSSKQKMGEKEKNKTKLEV